VLEENGEVRVDDVAQNHWGTHAVSETSKCRNGKMLSTVTSDM